MWNLFFNRTRVDEDRKFNPPDQFLRSKNKEYLTSVRVQFVMIR